MSRRNPHRHHGRLPRGMGFGIVCIAAGAFMLMANLGHMDWEQVLTWAPAFLLVTGLIHMLNHGFLRLWGHIQIVAGILLLAGTRGYGDIADRWWPMGLVWLGAVLCCRAFWQRWHPAPCPEAPIVCQDDSERHA